MQMCSKCGQPILLNQMYINKPVYKDGWQREHVSCPTPRQVAHALKLGRWTAACAKIGGSHEQSAIRPDDAI